MEEGYSYGYNNARDAVSPTPRRQVVPLPLPDELMKLKNLMVSSVSRRFPAAPVVLALRNWPRVAKASFPAITKPPPQTRHSYGKDGAGGGAGAASETGDNDGDPRRMRTRTIAPTALKESRQGRQNCAGPVAATRAIRLDRTRQGSVAIRMRREGASDPRGRLNPNFLCLRKLRSPRHGATGAFRQIRYSRSCSASASTRRAARPTRVQEEVRSCWAVREAGSRCRSGAGPWSRLRGLRSDMRRPTGRGRGPRK